MIEQALQRLEEHPRGRAIVITLSFLLGLLLLWPLADEYSDLTKNRAKLADELQQTQAAGEQLGDLENRVAASAQQLADLEARAVPEQSITDFRNELVELVRQSGCQVRRIDTGSVKTRSWFDNDDPLHLVQDKKKKKESGYELKSQPLNLSVSGTLPDLQRFLAALHKQQHLAHTKNLSLRPAGADRSEIVLDLELWLFDLVKKKQVSA